jgi:hypothetical protein
MNREKIVLLAKQKEAKKVKHSTEWDMITEWQKYIMDVIDDIDYKISGSYIQSFDYLKKFVDFSKFPEYSSFVVEVHNRYHRYKEALGHLINTCYAKNSVLEMTMKNE